MDIGFPLGCTAQRRTQSTIHSRSKRPIWFAQFWSLWWRKRWCRSWNVWMGWQFLKMFTLQLNGHWHNEAFSLAEEQRSLQSIQNIVEHILSQSSYGVFYFNHFNPLKSLKNVKTYFSSITSELFMFHTYHFASTYLSEE